MVKTLSRSALLARELLAAIARGALQPGDPIDIQALGRQHGVSRTVVREALADLGGKGLVVARPKVGTAVAPTAHWNLLDPVLVSVAIDGPEGPGSFLDEALALRSVIEPALAADAARDASRAQRARILGAVRALAGAVGAGDRQAQAEADALLHEAIADACGNRMLRSADRALEPVRALCRARLLARTAARGEALPETVRALGLQTALAVAIARGDAAAAAARALMLSRTDRPPPAAARTVSPTGRLPADGPALGPVPDRTLRAPHSAHARAATDIDWPETAMFVPPHESIQPLRRGRLDSDGSLSDGSLSHDAHGAAGTPSAALADLAVTDPVER